MYMLCDGSLGDCNCVSLRAAAQRSAKKKTNAKHGTQRMYKKCKCIVCRRGNAKRHRELRAKKKGEN